MRYTIEELLDNDSQLLNYYAKAKERWLDIIQRPSAEDMDKLASVLTVEQIWFENNCGGREIGQEIMAVVGIAQFYTTQSGFSGNYKKARRVYDAFWRSYCSLEVKSHAKQIAKDYDLLEDGYGL